MPPASTLSSNNNKLQSSFKLVQLQRSADLCKGCKASLLVSGSHWSRETAVMAVEAVASQFSTRWWSTLLLSSSTASGLRHHQQHRSMTSQPRAGPHVRAKLSDRQPGRGWDEVWFQVSGGACEAWILEAVKQSPAPVSTVKSSAEPSRSSLGIVWTKFRPKFDFRVQHRPTTKPQNAQTHTPPLS